MGFLRNIKVKILPLDSSCHAQNTYKDNTNFKGSVSPEFIRYVNEIREDCLLSCTGRTSKLLLNNVCDNLINKTKTVVENCFHPSSFLSIDRNTNALFIENAIIRKLIGDYRCNQGFIALKGTPPIESLNILRREIHGRCDIFFHEAYCKNLFGLDPGHQPQDYENMEPETAIKIRDIVMWNRNQFNILPSVFPNYSKDIIEDMEEYREIIIERLNKVIEKKNAKNS